MTGYRGRHRLRLRRADAGHPRPRHRHGDGAGHRVDHGLAAAGQGERRLGGQRRDAHDRRRARRRGARLAAVQRLPCATWTPPSPACPRSAADAARDSLGGALAVAAARRRRAPRHDAPRRRSSAACTAPSSSPRRSRWPARSIALVFLPARARRSPRPTAGRARGGAGVSAPPRRRRPGAGPGGRARRRPTRRSSRATLRLLLEDGYRGLTMEAVRRALGRRQGDALSPLRLQGGARARMPCAHLHQDLAAPGHGLAARRLRGHLGRPCSPPPAATNARRLHAAAAGRVGRRPRAAPDLLREPRAAAPRGAARGARAGRRARRAARRRRPRARGRRARRRRASTGC